MYLADREQLVPQLFHRDTSVLGKERKEKEISTARELSIWNYVTNNSKKHALKGSSVYAASVIFSVSMLKSTNTHFKFPRAVPCI